MNRLLIAASLAVAAHVAQAQEPAAPPSPPQAQQAPERATSGGHSTLVYHGPHQYPARTRGREGDPPIVDHSMDTLVVEPPRSTITLTTTPLP